MNSLKDDKESLIQLIEWYQNEYHHYDHSELIQNVRNTDDSKLLELYEKIVDGWFDY